MIKNTASQSISAVLINKTDGSPVTTGTTSVYVTIDGGTQTAGTGTVEHEGNGQWTYFPTQGETNGDSLAFLFLNSNAVAVNLQVYTETAAAVAAEAGAAAASTDLLTLTELKNFPALANAATSDNTVLQGLITAASLDFETEWKNPGIQRVFTEKYTWPEIRTRSRSGNLLWLRKYPVVSVTSITDPASNTIDSDEYWIDYDKGVLRTTGGWTIPQDSNGFVSYWTIIYTAGRWADVTEVPANIKTACKMWVNSLYKRPDRDVISKRIGDFAVTYKAEEGSGLELTPVVRRMIAAYKRLDI